MWMPILLFVAALIVNIGTMQAWRVRGEIVARDAVWRGRWPRRGDVEPRPQAKVWPPDARMEVARAERQIDELHHPNIDHPVAYGPLDPIGVRDLLRQDRGLAEGISSIQRDLPMLGKIGDYDSGYIRHPLLRGQWQTAEIAWTDVGGNRRGLPANRYRRIKALYELREQDPGLAQNFVQALAAMYGISNYRALRVLDRDEEIRRYRGGYVDFHPRIYRPYMCPRVRFDFGLATCELDPEVVKKQQVDRLIDSLRPDGEVRLGEVTMLPSRLTSFFLNMYRSAVSRLEQQIEQMQQEASEGGPSYAAEIAAAQAEIAQLQPKIEQLEAFQKRLPQFLQRMREEARIRLAGS